MSKHTLGPWRVSEKRREYIDIKHDNQKPGAISWVLAQVVARQSWEAEAEANAKLIAAAPELLEALQNIIDDMDSEFGTGYDYNKARAAIRKATE